ncbi:protein RALF-like 34 [Andrographis paniculata]|uniref:protein RALF-like 34 n=1 Tax=Andrographis paniculata TaxID=175694 RepID=UPI0021E864AA|nr:protein RALF-like 34 [Andrographis paniculata]
MAMEVKLQLIPILICILLVLSIPEIIDAADAVAGSSLRLSLGNGTLERPVQAELRLVEDDDEEDEEGFEEEEELGQRRSLVYWGHQWPRRRYYISYGALSANRIPCPARSGRSYYTHNCYRARGPVRPYVRGCSAITRCRS